MGKRVLVVEAIGWAGGGVVGWVKRPWGPGGGEGITRVFLKFPGTTGNSDENGFAGRGMVVEEAETVFLWISS